MFDLILEEEALDREIRAKSPPTEHVREVFGVASRKAELPWRFAFDELLCVYTRISNVERGEYSVGGSYVNQMLPFIRLKNGALFNALAGSN
eukprot:gnl/Chilomastix_caulleri/2722.p1 GENE.gnl/Chilomastix_caulleri/2722~~gnl/Chilomastix_caulleri/2722.p1  ORF type:complete len:92 (+),score=19.50 gnl/Chilomastix_caulleri/2722:138-413(+)